MSNYIEFILIKYTTYITILKSLSQDELYDVVKDFKIKVLSNKCSDDNIKLIDILVNLLTNEVNKLKNIT